MYRIILSMLSAFILVAASENKLSAQGNDHDIIKSAIDSFFIAMADMDTAWIARHLLPEATLTTVHAGDLQNKTISRKEFFESLMQAKKGGIKIEEKLLNYSIRIDQNFAIVSTDYSFYVQDKFVHCGIDLFTLVKRTAGWKIMGITDTRRKENCNEDPVADINAFMDAWHVAAAKADADTFFGSMTEDAIYIGTDQTERWLRDELREWSKKYFDRGAAWDFRPIERQVHLSEDGQMAWFNETLDTWMGVCRSSGVLTKTSEGWRIKHYHLSVTIDNDKIDGFLKVIGKKE